MFQKRREFKQISCQSDFLVVSGELQETVPAFCGKDWPVENPYDAPEQFEEASPPSLPINEVKPWGPWWTLLWGFVVICIWSVAQAVSGLGAILFLQGTTVFNDKDGLLKAMENLPRDGDVAGAMTFFAGLVGFVMVLAVVKVRGVSYAQGLDLKAPKRWWMFPVALVGTYLLMIVMGIILKPFQQNQGELDPFMAEMISATDYLPLLLLGVAVAAPVFEEVFFRGLLQTGLRQSFLGRWGAIILIAVLFSFIHQQYQDPVAFVMLFTLGVAFGVARELTGSLWVPIGMHALNNLLATFGVIYMQEQSPASLKDAVEALARWGF